MNKESPFLGNLEIVVRRVPLDIRSLRYDGGGDYYQVYSRETRYMEVELQPSALVYRDENWIELSRVGLMGLMYIMQNIGVGSDVIRLDYKRGCERVRMSYSDWGKMLVELEEWGYISRKSKSDYWVNPAKIFRGNRRKKFKDKVIVQN